MATMSTLVVMLGSRWYSMADCEDVTNNEDSNCTISKLVLF